MNKASQCESYNSKVYKNTIQLNSKVRIWRFRNKQHVDFHLTIQLPCDHALPCGCKEIQCATKMVPL